MSYSNTHQDPRDVPSFGQEDRPVALAAPVSEFDSIHVATSPPIFGMTLILRIVIAGMAGWSAYAMVHNAYNRGGGSWESAFDQAIYFTTFSVVIVALAYGLSVLRVVLPGSLRRKTEGNYGWFRGLAVLMSVMTGIIFAALLDGTYPDLRGLFAHLLIPILVAIDWVFLGRNQEKLHPAAPFVWAALILPYLAVYWWDAEREGGGGPMYNFLNPASSDFLQTVLMLLTGFLIAGYVLWGIGRLKALITGTSTTIPYTHVVSYQVVPTNQAALNYHRHDPNADPRFGVHEQTAQGNPGQRHPGQEHTANYHPPQGTQHYPHDRS